MRLLTNQKVIDVMERTLNCVDPRLMDHGLRVAYLIFKILWPLRKHSDKQLRDICILAMLHDVGAYKTEEIDKMVVFETIDVWEHSIYGYLFLKYFSPLKALAPAILFHHAECDELERLEAPDLRLLAQLISLCDRADVFLHYNGNSKEFMEHMQKYRGIKYRGDVVDMFIASGIDMETVYETIDDDAEFDRVFRGTPLTDGEVSGYLKMIICSIDFRSSQTVIHTIASTVTATTIAAKMGADASAVEKIETGATLHDIGKIGIPVHILESTGKLNDEEMKIMRTHVDITGEILDGNVDEEIKNIAVKHHEKLNGTGYPRQLGASDIAMYDRIVAVADIFSALCGARTYKSAYPREKISTLLEDMSSQNLIDAEVAALAMEHFDAITAKIELESAPVIETYNAITEEYAELRNVFALGVDLAIV